MGLDDFDARAAALVEADGTLISGDIAAAARAFDAALEAFGGAGETDGYDEVVYRAALLTRLAICHFLTGAEQEADEVLGYADRIVTAVLRRERDEERALVLAHVQDDVRVCRQRLVEAMRGNPLELPIALCPHNRQVPLLPCGFTVEHP